MAVNKIKPPTLQELNTKKYTPPTLQELNAKKVNASPAPLPTAVQESKSAATAKPKIGNMSINMAKRYAGTSEQWGRTPENKLQYMHTTPQKLVHDIKYNTERAGAAMLGLGEGVFDYISAGGNKLLAGATSLGGLVPNAVSDSLNRAADHTLNKNYTADYEESIKERYKPSELQEKMSGVGQSVVRLLPSIAATVYTGGGASGALGKEAAGLASNLFKANSGLALMGVSSAGNAASSAKAQGATTGQALRYGTLSGATEILTEKIAGGIPGLPEGAITGAVQKALKNPTAQRAVGKLADIAGEGFEEAISTIIDPVLRRVTFDPNASSATKAEILESALTGALVSGIMQGGVKVGQMAGDYSNGVKQRRIDAINADKLADQKFVTAETAAAQLKTASPLPVANTNSQEQQSTKISSKVQASPVKANLSLFDESVLSDTNTARKKYIEYARAKFPESVINKETGNRILISRNGLDKVLSGRISKEKYASAFHVPELIENATKINSAPYNKPNMQQDAFEKKKQFIYNYDYYDSPINIGEKPYTAHIRVRNTNMGGKYYGHTISVVEQIKIEPSARSAAGAPAANLVYATTDSIFNNSIARNAENINNNLGNAVHNGVENSDIATETPKTETQVAALPMDEMNDGGKLRNALKFAHRNIVSGQAELERVAKLQNRYKSGSVNANDLAQASRSVGGTVDYIAEKGLVDRAGNKIGKAWAEVMNLSDEQLRQLNTYMLHKHNVDRMSLTERYEPNRTAAEQAVNDFRMQYPDIGNLPEYQLKKMSQQFETPGTRALASEYLQLLDRAEKQNAVTNKPVIAKRVPGKTQDVPYSAEESAEIAAKLEKEHPELISQAAEYKKFHHDFMTEWAVNSGLMSAEQLNSLEERYPSYLPTYRTKNAKHSDNGVIKRGTVNTSSPIDKAVGDLSEIVPLQDAGMIQANQIVRAARRNELFLNLYETAKAHPQEMQKYVRILDNDSGLDFSEQNFQDFQQNLEKAVMSADNNTYKIMAMKNGKPIMMEVNADIYAGLQNLYGQDQGSANALTNKIGDYVTKPFKQLTTGLNPLFPITNFARDIQTGYVNTISDRKLFATYAKDVGSAVNEMMHGSADWENFKALGGRQTGFYHNEKGFTESRAISQRKGVKGAMDKAKDTLSFVGENTEAMIRFAEYKAAIKKYGNDQVGRQKAIQAAADVTVNFSRSAPATKHAENVVAYLNASVQGLDKMARQIKEHPIKTTYRTTEMLTMTTILLWLVNRDNENYQKLNDRTKDNYFCIPNIFGEKDENGNATTFIKIPKSREWGVAMSAFVERALRNTSGEKAGDAYDGILNQLGSNLLPPNPVTDNIGKTIIELNTNKDFAGRSIVPERMKDLSPQYQYDYNTSGIGKTIAKGINAIPLLSASPMQIDHVIDSNLGFLGDWALSATRGKPKNALDVAGNVFLSPLKQKFIADPLYQSGVTDKFYREMDKATNAAADRNMIENLPSDVVTPEDKKVSELTKSSKKITELRQQERQILESGARGQDAEQQIRDIRRKIIDIAKGAPETAQAAMDDYSKIYVQEISHLSDKRQEQARTGYAQHNIPYKTFLTAYNTLTDIKSDKDKDGKSVGNASEKKKAYIDTMQWLDDSQREYLYDIFEVSKKARGVKIYFSDEPKLLPIAPKKGIPLPNLK